MNDTEHHIHFYLDSEFVGNRIGIHPNDNSATVWLNADDLVKLLQENGSNVEIVEIS